jgi:hypothetical protein
MVKLTGIPAAAYRGVEASSPPQLYYDKRDPGPNDKHNWRLGSLWVNNIRQIVWILVGLENNVATWIQLPGFVGVPLHFQTDNGVAGPDITGTLNLPNSGLIQTTVPNPNEVDIGIIPGAQGQVVMGEGIGNNAVWGDLISLDNSITIDTTTLGTVDLASIGVLPQANTFHTDDGHDAHPDINGILNIFGANNINTSAVPAGGNNVNINLNNTVHITGTAWADTAAIGNNIQLSGNTVSSTNVNGDVMLYPYGNHATGNVKINNSVDDTFIMDPLGYRRMPYQSCFMAYLDHAIPNFTGDDVPRRVPINNILFDQNNNYNPVTHLFTAPVTGKYFFTAGVLLTNYLYQFPNRNWQNLLFWCAGINLAQYNSPDWSTANNWFDQTRFNGGFSAKGFVITSMNSGDVMDTTIQIGQNVNVIGLYGSANQPYTYFGGFLIC